MFANLTRRVDSLKCVADSGVGPSETKVLETVNSFFESARFHQPDADHHPGPTFAALAVNSDHIERIGLQPRADTFGELHHLPVNVFI